MNDLQTLCLMAATIRSRQEGVSYFEAVKDAAIIFQHMTGSLPSFINESSPAIKEAVRFYDERRAG